MGKASSMQSSGDCKAALGYVYVCCDSRKRMGRSITSQFVWGMCWCFELVGDEPGLCKAQRAPALQFRAALTQCKFPGLGLAGVWSRCVGRGAWLSLDLSVQACSMTAASTRTSWFSNSPAILYYAVTLVTAVQIFAGLCSGVWPLHPWFGGCRSWIKLCLGCSFCSAPLRAPK